MVPQWSSVDCADWMAGGGRLDVPGLRTCGNGPRARGMDARIALGRESTPSPEAPPAHELDRDLGQGYLFTRPVPAQDAGRPAQRRTPIRPRRRKGDA